MDSWTVENEDDTSCVAASAQGYDVFVEAKKHSPVVGLTWRVFILGCSTF